MIRSAETHGCYASKDELNPGHNWHDLSDDSVTLHNNLPYLSMDPPLQVELQVHTHRDLEYQEDHYGRYGFRVDVWRKLAAFVLMAEEVSYYSESGAGRLYRSVPFGAYYLS